jgi:phosphoribosylformylglycinamidine cyclo-ligase
MKQDAYARAGVDVGRVRGIHASIAKTLEKTFRSRTGKFGSPLIGIGHYAGLIDIGHGQAMAMHTDGVGTKQRLAVEMQRFDTVGIDCVAMTVNDLLCLGCEPVALLDYIALEKEDEALVAELVKGLASGARESSAAIVGGETAIMGDSVKGFDLVSMGVGVVDKTRILDGSAITEGDRIIGAESSGLHSNGYTLARRVLQARHSLEERIDSLGSTLGEAMLTPTRIYVKPVLEVLGRCEVHGVAHITGGAFGKLRRLVTGRSLGFSLDLPAPPPIFDMIQKEGGITELEMLRTFNMGVGLCIVTPENEAERVIRILRRRGVSASDVGYVKRGSGVLAGSLRVAD